MSRRDQVPEFSWLLIEVFIGQELHEEAQEALFQTWGMRIS